MPGKRMNSPNKSIVQPLCGATAPLTVGGGAREKQCGGVLAAGSEWTESGVRTVSDDAEKTAWNFKEINALINQLPGIKLWDKNILSK